jgi:ribulose-phosphate 3-epimerase
MPPQKRPPQIVPSVLPADFALLGDDCQRLEKAGADRIQWDIMDGHFVPNLTFGPDIVAASREVVDLPFEAHLMVTKPDPLIARFVDAGCELVIVHTEACPHLHRTLTAIREVGAKPGLALNPATPLQAVAHVLDLIDLLLVMTVNPGFGGQEYLASMEKKIVAARQLIESSGHRVQLEVDGGIGPTTIAGAARAGADVFCAGSSLFRDPDGLEAAIRGLRERAMGASR